MDKLLSQLGSCKDTFERQLIADRVLTTVLRGTVPACAVGKEAPVVLALSKALCPLLDAALQQEDCLTQPRYLIPLDTCSTLLHCIVCHVECRDSSPQAMSKHAMFSGIANSVVNSGLLTALPKALTKAASMLESVDSLATRTCCFTHFIGHMLALWNSLIRTWPAGVLALRDSDLFAPLVLPGARLSAAVLRIYASFAADALIRFNHPNAGVSTLAGMQATSVTRWHRPPPGMAVNEGAWERQRDKQAGRNVVLTAVAQALRVADMLSRSTYKLALTDAPPPAGSLQAQVLSEPAVMQLVATMLFVQAKRLHTKLGGMSAAAPPATKQSGRASKKKSAQAGSSNGSSGGTSSASGTQPILVPPRHNLLAGELGLHMLLNDETIFNLVTCFDGPPPPTPSEPMCPMLSTQKIQSELADAVFGLEAIVWHYTSSHENLQHTIQQPESQQFSGSMCRAIMRTLAEVCLLDKTTGWPADVLVLFRQLSLHTLDDFCGNPGTEAYYLLCNAAPAWYAGPRSPLASPVVHELMSPVLRDAVGLLVPLLLPECHKPSPPEETVRKLRKLLPVQIAILAASVVAAGAAGPECLSQLICDHPLHTARALEGGLRVDWTLREARPLMRCTLLRTVPAVLASLGLPDQSQAAAGASTSASSSSSATTTAANQPSKLALAVVAAGRGQQTGLLGQLHALLTTCVKCASDLNRSALVAAAAADTPAGGSSSSSSTWFGKPCAEQVQDPDFLNIMAAGLTRGLGPQPGLTGTPQQARDMAQLLVQAAGTANSEALMAGLNKRSKCTAGQFGGTLSVISSTAAAAAALGRAIGAAAAAVTNAGGGGSSSQAGQTAAAASAPLMSLIGRCLFLTGSALAAAHSDAPGLQDSEFDSFSSDVATLLSCLDLVAADNSCQQLLAPSSSSTAAFAKLRAGLRQQQQQQQQDVNTPPTSRAVADRLCVSGLSAQMQAVGAALCGVIGGSVGVCGNPGCSALSELSEAALVTAGGGKKGRGKCSGCDACSYCSRECHWPSHKPFCKAHRKAAAATPAAEAPAA